MSTAEVIKLPTAAAAEPPRKTWPGALPKSIARMCEASRKRSEIEYEKTMIDGRIAELSRNVEMFEMAIIAAKLEIAILRGIEPGSDLAFKAAWYLDVAGWSAEGRSAWEAQHGPNERPY